jgi:histidine triad (HIT) family protein
MLLAPKLAAEHGLHDGFKLAVNVGHGGGQEVFHLHLHILGTPSLGGA